MSRRRVGDPTSPSPVMPIPCWSSLSLSFWSLASFLLLSLSRLALSAFVLFRRLAKHLLFSRRKARAVAEFFSLQSQVNGSGTGFITGKLPGHLALTVQDLGDEADPRWWTWAWLSADGVTQVANFLVWCVVLGIPFVTVYDPRGILKKKREKLSEKVLAAQKSYLGKDFACCRIKSEELRIDYGYTNGTSVRHTTNVHVIGREDGKADIVNAARELAAERGRGTDTGADAHAPLSPASFESRLRGNGRGFPEPDCMITVGPVRTTAGFLPWHVRLTEIFHVPSISDLDEESFTGVLKQFARCQQRFGT